MVRNNPIQPAYFGNQLLVELPFYKVSYNENNEQLPLARKTWFHGEALDKSLESSFYNIKERNSGDAPIIELKQCFTTGSINYRIPMRLKYSRDPEYYGKQLRSLEARNPLYSYNYEVVAGKISVLLLDKNNVFTYSEFEQAGRYKNFVLELSANDDFKGIVSDSDSRKSPD